MNHETHVFNVHGFHIKYLRIFGIDYRMHTYISGVVTLHVRCNEKLNGNTHPKCDTMEIDVRGWINRGGVDLRSFNIKSKSVAKELSSWKNKTEIDEYFVWHDTELTVLFNGTSDWKTKTNVNRKIRFNLFKLYWKTHHTPHITPFLILFPFVIYIVIVSPSYFHVIALFYRITKSTWMNIVNIVYTVECVGCHRLCIEDIHFWLT